MADAKKNTSMVTLSKIQIQNGTERTMFATWTWNKSHTSGYRVIWKYGTGQGKWFWASDTTETQKQSVWTAPENATKVQICVTPISETHKVNDKEQAYWTGKQAYSKSYVFQKADEKVPDKAPTPDAKLNEYTKNQLDISLSNLDNDWSAVGVKFAIKRDDWDYMNEIGSVEIKDRGASISYIVEPGHTYKACCAGYNKKDQLGDYSDYSSEVVTAPSTPDHFIISRAVSSTSVELTWVEVVNCTGYEIEFTTNDAYFDSNPDQVSSKTIESTATYATFTGLESGKEYYFRVRATNSAGNSGWSMHASVVLGKEPSAPTTWSSTTTAMVGESLNLYWVHNSQDGSYEKMAELELTVNGSTETKTFYNNTSEDDQDKARSYSVNTGQYTEGTTIKWRVRTSGITSAYSEWSVLREVNVYARPTVALIVTNQNGAVISSLSSFPFYLKASPGPASQKPISYHVEITADDGYETVDQVGNVIRISAGESIYSKNFNSSSILIVEFSAGNVDFENGMTYTATVTVSMNSGLSCSASKTFTVDWEETISEPNAEIGYDSERYTCQIRPYCEDMDGNLINGILLSVYRREYNGEFIEIASGLPNSASHYVIDPHPALDYARYRIIATETATGAVSYYDVPGYPINEPGVIIQWSEAWSAFDVSDANEADVVDTPPWSGSLIRIPYNIDVSDKADPDVTLVKYAGRKRQVSYYGTQLGESSTWKVEIPADDNETLYALRRLMIWTGDVYVREPSGSGYWANVKVSFSRTHCALTIPVTFDITRVEGGM